MIRNVGEGVTRMTGGIWQMRAIKFALRKSRNRRRKRRRRTRNAEWEEEHGI